MLPINPMKCPLLFGQLAWASFISLCLSSTTTWAGEENTEILQVQLVQESNYIEGRVDDAPFFRYQVELLEPPEGVDPIYSGNGFIHQLRSPAGKLLTDTFPEQYWHHHGVYSSWTRATFLGERHDFWNKHRGTGTHGHLKVKQVEGDQFTVVRLMESYDLGPAIYEVWQVQVSSQAGMRILDFSLEQTPAAPAPKNKEPIILNVYHYGGFAFRGPETWNPDDEAAFLGPMQIMTDTGITDITVANHGRYRWVAAYGQVGDGHLAGVAYMGHPENVRAPQPVRIHPRIPYFTFAPVVVGDLEINLNSPYRAKYRIVTFDGEPDSEKLEQLFNVFVQDN